MPEHLRALVVILILASVVFSLTKRLVLDLVPGQDFDRRRNLWFVLTLVAFLSHSFWLYVAIAGLILFIAGQREQNRVTLFFLLLFLIPNASAVLSGLSLINYLFSLNHVRLLTLILLLPAFLLLKRHNRTLPFARTWPDKLLAGYLLLAFALQLRETSITDTLRQGLYLFIDVFTPYYVVSRTLRDMQSFKDALLGFVLAVMIIAAVGVFESSRHWLLYSALLGQMGLDWGLTNYLGRAGILRASAVVGQPIALGYVMVVAIGFYLYLKEGVRSRLSRYLSGVLLAAGLVAPLSRGPWVGAVALLVAFIWTGRQVLQRLALLAMASLVALSLLAVLPGGQMVIDLLPFIGMTESENITYREQLLNNAIVVIQRNPWFGSVNYLETPEMQAMIQGQGIIDIVNTYIGVALQMGGIGLALFVGFFVMVLLGIYKAIRALPDKNDEMYRLGRALFATMAGILVIIYTVSSITIIPVVYWSVAGLGVAYAQMVRERVGAGGKAGGGVASAR